MRGSLPRTHQPLAYDAGDGDDVLIDRRRQSLWHLNDYRMEKPNAMVMVVPAIAAL